jgi:hypothetical protein
MIVRVAIDHTKLLHTALRHVARRSCMTLQII